MTGCTYQESIRKKCAQARTDRFESRNERKKRIQNFRGPRI